MWWKRAQPGDKVTCIDDSGTLRYVTLGKPEMGRVYTVKAMWASSMTDRIVVSLRELGDFGWYVERFKPVKSTETGMSIIRQIADGIREPEKESA